MRPERHESVVVQFEFIVLSAKCLTAFSVCFMALGSLAIYSYYLNKIHYGPSMWLSVQLFNEVCKSLQLLSKYNGGRERGGEIIQQNMPYGTSCNFTGLAKIRQHLWLIQYSMPYYNSVVEGQIFDT